MMLECRRLPDHDSKRENRQKQDWDKPKTLREATETLKRVKNATYKTRERYLQITDFSCGSEVKESVCNAGDVGSIPGSGRSP